MAKHGSRSQMATSISQPCDSMTDLVSDGLLHRLPKQLNGEESACQCSRCRFDLWVRKIPCRRKWPPTPVLLPGESHGQKRWWATALGVSKSWTRLNMNGLFLTSSIPSQVLSIIDQNFLDYNHFYHFTYDVFLSYYISLWLPLSIFKFLEKKFISKIFISH